MNIYWFIRTLHTDTLSLHIDRLPVTPCDSSFLKRGFGKPSNNALKVRSLSVIPGHIEVRDARRDCPEVLRLPTALARDVKLSARLNQVCANARSLQNLSRFVIRKSLGSSHLPTSVARLPLPRSLQDFLLLKY